MRFRNYRVSFLQNKLMASAVIRFLVFISILTFQSYTFCQEKEDSSSALGIRACIGFSAPIGQFGQLSKDGGFANAGILGSIETVSPLSHLLDLTFSFTYSTNKMNVSPLQKLVSPYRISAGKYHTFWLLTGLQFGPDKIGGTRVYLSGNVGFLYTVFPTIIIESGGNKIEGIADSKLSLAIGLGAGAQLYNINFGLRFITGSIEYSQQESLQGIVGGASSSFSVSILSLYAGVMF